MFFSRRSSRVTAGDLAVSPINNKIKKGALESSHVMKQYKHGAARGVGGTLILATEGITYIVGGVRFLRVFSFYC